MWQERKYPVKRTKKSLSEQRKQQERSIYPQQECEVEFVFEDRFVWLDSLDDFPCDFDHDFDF